MRGRHSIRQDIHERFVTIVARAEAKLKGEEKAMERRLAAALAREAPTALLEAAQAAASA